MVRQAKKIHNTPNMYYFYYCVVYRRVAQSAHTHPVVSEAEQALKKRQRKEEGGIDTQIQ